MEAEPPGFGPRLVRAARSLDVNRRYRERIETRIERATDTLNAYLGLYGLTCAQLGAYEVALVDGKIELTRRPVGDVTQLPLPEPEMGGQNPPDSYV